MHRESTKVTVMSRWPLYKVDRYGRFDCIVEGDVKHHNPKINPQKAQSKSNKSKHNDLFGFPSKCTIQHQLIAGLLFHNKQKHFNDLDISANKNIDIKLSAHNRFLMVMWWLSFLGVNFRVMMFNITFGFCLLWNNKPAINWCWIVHFEGNPKRSLCFDLLDF
jgi:hypothetical protein